jgi:hypothetical protein
MDPANRTLTAKNQNNYWEMLYMRIDCFAMAFVLSCCVVAFHGCDRANDNAKNPCVGSTTGDNGNNISVKKDVPVTPQFNRNNELTQSNGEDIWEEDYNPSTTITFKPTKIIVNTDNSEEIWDIIEGNGAITGLKVKRDNIVLKAHGIQKFNEMGFSLGERHWCLRKKGTKKIKWPPGEAPNDDH